MDTVYIILKNECIVFVTDNEESIVKYLDSKGVLDTPKAKEWFPGGVPEIMKWLDEGHLVEEITEATLPAGYRVNMFEPDYDYDEESPYYLTDNWR